MGHKPPVRGSHGIAVNNNNNNNKVWDLRYQWYLQVIPSGYARDMDPHVEEDKGHDDVIHVALVARKEHHGHSTLVDKHTQKTTTNNNKSTQNGSQ